MAVTRSRVQTALITCTATAVPLLHLWCLPSLLRPPHMTTRRTINRCVLLLLLLLFAAAVVSCGACNFFRLVVLSCPLLVVVAVSSKRTTGNLTVRRQQLLLRLGTLLGTLPATGTEGPWRHRNVSSEVRFI